MIRLSIGGCPCRYRAVLYHSGPTDQHIGTLSGPRNRSVVIEDVSCVVSIHIGGGNARTDSTLPWLAEVFPSEIYRKYLDWQSLALWRACQLRR